MTVQASFHIFGSVSGYRTLACSTDVTLQERAVLETLGFGQTDDESYFHSLALDPAGMGRPLPSGRYALTRCIEGDRDSAGRRTLRYDSLIFSAADWNGPVAPVALDVLRADRLWQLDQANPGLPLHVSLPNRPAKPGNRGRTVSLLDQYLTSNTTRDIIALPHSSELVSSIVLMPACLPLEQRSQIAWGLRVLSPGAPVQIATLDPAATTSGRRRVVQPRRQQLVHPYAKALDDAWAISVDAALSLAGSRRQTSVNDYVVSAAAQADYETISHEQPRPLRRRILIAACSVAFALGLGLAIFLSEVNDTTAQGNDAYAAHLSQLDQHEEWDIELIRAWVEGVRSDQDSAVALSRELANAERAMDAIEQARNWESAANSLIEAVIRDDERLLAKARYDRVCGLMQHWDTLSINDMDAGRYSKVIVHCRDTAEAVYVKLKQLRAEDDKHLHEWSLAYVRYASSRLKSEIEAIKAISSATISDEEIIRSQPHDSKQRNNHEIDTGLPIDIELIEAIRNRGGESGLRIKYAEYLLEQAKLLHEQNAKLSEEWDRLQEDIRYLSEPSKGDGDIAPRKNEDRPNKKQGKKEQ